MKNRTRILVASLVGSFATLLPLSLLSVASVIKPALVGIELGDDAPVMSAYFILVLISCTYPTLVIIMVGIGAILSSRNQLTRKNLLLIAVVLSMGIGIYMGFQSPFGLKDQLIGVVIFYSLSLLSSLCGVFSWWFVANMGRNDESGLTI